MNVTISNLSDVVVTFIGSDSPVIKDNFMMNSKNSYSNS
jgi:hypothetical protein